MKEETSVSAAIIAGEHEEATAERQIDEIDEQIRNWSRYLLLFFIELKFLYSIHIIFITIFTCHILCLYCEYNNQ